LAEDVEKIKGSWDDKGLDLRIAVKANGTDQLNIIDIYNLQIINIMEMVYSKLMNFLRRTPIDDDLLDVYRDQRFAFSLNRKLEYGQTTGFLIQYSDDFLVINNFDIDFLTTNGFSLIKRADITKVYTFQPLEQDFFQISLNVKNVNIGFLHQLPLNSSIREIILHLHHILDPPVISYYTEKVTPDQYEIGIIRNPEIDLTAKFLKLDTIGEDGFWRDSPTILALDEITKIEWNTEYLKTLIQINQLNDQENENNENNNDENNNENNENINENNNENEESREIVIENLLYHKVNS